MEVSSANSASLASVQKTMRADQAQQVQQRQAEQQPADAKTVNPAPATPVINTQGQMTGRLLNVTA